MTLGGPNADQAEYWSTGGQSWIDHEADQDQLLAPATEAVLEKAALQPGAKVLDIGCGTGAHALAVAAQVQPRGQVLALDVSKPFLKRTKQRAKATGLPVETFHGDAQVAELPGGFDVATSRFGVMFFSDPTAAFANIAKALRPGGRMIFAAWAPVSVNPYWRLPIAIASARLGTPPVTPPNAPGPMGLADRGFAEAALVSAGLQDVKVTEQQIVLGHQGGAQELAAQNLRIGSAARILRLFDGTETDRRAIQAELTQAYGAYEDGALFQIPATLNMIQARVP